MPRERTLSHGFFTNHILAKLPPLTRLLYEGIWTLCDFDGCFEWDPDALAMKLLPRDNFDPKEALEALQHGGFIQHYEAEGQSYGFVLNWHKYQDPHPKEKSVYPKPIDHPEFQVRVKDPKYRGSSDYGFAMPEIKRGIYPLQQLASNLPASDQQVASNAFPSIPSIPSCPSNPSIPTKEEKKVPRKRVTKSDSESLEDILGGGKGTSIHDAYWELAEVFGANKNYAPKTSARIYVTAIKSVTHEEILGKAKGLARSVSEQKYLPMLAKWLSEEGYRNPDSKSSSNIPTGKVHHRTETDLDGIRQLRERDERRKNEPKQEEETDDSYLQNMF